MHCIADRMSAIRLDYAIDKIKITGEEMEFHNSVTDKLPIMP